MRASRSSFLGCLLLLSACGASQPRPAQPIAAPALEPGDPDAPPSLRALPELAEGASGNTARTHQGLLLARQALDAALPEPPVDHSYAALHGWVDTTVVAWLDRRREQTEATRERFLLEGEPSSGEAIVSHAVLGLLQEDTAHSLARIPAPSELDSEPEIADMYRDIVRAQADSFVSTALLEWKACAEGAYRGPADMQAWAEFCHARFDRLKEQATRRSAGSSRAVSQAR